MAQQARSFEHAVVDADGHVVEPLDLWDRYLDPEYRSRAPRFVSDERGHPCLLLGERLEMRAAMLLTFGPDYDLAGASSARRPGGWDPDARLVDMDSEGIDVAVLFPSVSFYFPELDDAPLQVALCRAYNRWLADYCAPAPDRLIGVALLPFGDVDAAVRELETAVEHHGFRAAFFRPNPQSGRVIQHPAYDRFWQCASSLGVPIAVHEGLSDNLPTLGKDRFDNPAIQHVLSHPFEQMTACAAFILTGVLERHPSLKVAFLESGAAWLPYWLGRLDSHFETWRKLLPQLRMKPSEYFRRQCVISTDPEEEAVDAVVRHVGAECIVWSSDYPHPDSHFPGAVAKTLSAMGGIADADRARIFGANACRLYGIDVPADRSAAA
ncbi:MAG TPA: amidohydrolase family protein [Candidatus Binatia bacterium]|nr:amidohydrolase family protein [Candidatus Binatia bacterium]